MSRTKKDIERDEQIYQLSTLVAGRFSLQEVLDRLAAAAVKILNIDPAPSPTSENFLG